MELVKVNVTYNYAWFIVVSPLGLVCVGHMVARLALVLAERPNFEACGIAAFGLQNSVGYRRRDRTTQLTESLREGPQAILHTRQHVITACGYKKIKKQDLRSKINLLRFDVKHKALFSQGALFYYYFLQLESKPHWAFYKADLSIPRAFSFRMCQGLYPPTS